VVRIDSAELLIDSMQHACHYETVDGKPLAAGYYLALWPAGACLSFHGRELRYLGPFATKAAACLLQTSAMGLEIVVVPANGDRADVATPLASHHRRRINPPSDRVRAAFGMPTYQGA
jgi:hypothetical protein